MTEHIQRSPHEGQGPAAYIGEVITELTAMGDTPYGLLHDVAERTTRAVVALGQVAEGAGSVTMGEIHRATTQAEAHLTNARAAMAGAAEHLRSYKTAIGGGTTDSDVQTIPREPAAQARAPGDNPRVKAGKKNRRAADKKENDPALAFKLTAEEFVPAVVNTRADMLNQIVYNSLAAATRRALARSTNTEIFFIPAVRAMIDAVLKMVETPGARSRLPLEIDDRAAIAQRYIGRVADIFNKEGTFEQFYAGNAFLSDFVDEDYIGTFRHDHEYIRKLGTTTFSDVAVVAGGAYRLLQEQFGDVPNATEIIANSKELAVISGVPKEHAMQMMRIIGVPYAHRNSLLVRTDDAGKPVEVTFKPDTLAKIRSFFTAEAGCPARRLKATEPGPWQTELDRGWVEIVRFLIPQGATAHNTTANGRTID